MKTPFDMKRFSKDEDGSLLVFFAVSVLTILGVWALSFDMGRRAATQTDMQSFADNVALAAAGELDGSANAIINARAAASSVIIAANEQLKAGTGVAAANLTITFDVNTDLVFYTALPPHDRPGTFDPALLGDSANANYKYALPTVNTTTDPTLARFVGVTLDTRDVDWLFGEVLTTATAAPDPAIGAIAIAGNTGYTCEISPLMFCLPRDASGNVEDLDTGIAVQLQTVGNGAAWNPGQFGYLDISSIPDAVTGPCASETPESRKQACLLAQGIGACFSDRGVDIQTGQRGGQEPAGFNLPFGIFGQAMNNLRGDPIYDTGPHVISGQTVNSGSCRATGETGDPNAWTGTMAFPTDDCHPNCLDANGQPTRFGDGNWTTGRDTYVATNYTVWDPADPGVNPPLIQGDWFDFPQPDFATDPVAGLTRYEYYLLEIERAANGGLMSGPEYVGAKFASNGADDNPSSSDDVLTYTTWDDFWRDLGGAGDPPFNPIIPNTHHNRDEYGLPQCNQVDPTSGPDRRLVVVAGINCPPPGDPGHLNGDEDDVPVAQYYEVFLLAPARDSSGSTEGPGGGNDPLFELYVEIIRPLGSEGGASTVTNTAFRELVQLYR